MHLLDRAVPRSADWRLAHDVIGRQSSHLAHMVDDCFDVGRTIAAKISLERQPLDLHLAVDQALGALRAAGKTARRHVDYQGSSVWVSADRTRIEQVLSNLVSNAVKHTPRAGASPCGWQRRAARSCSQSPNDGAGMDAETAARAFELFSVEARAGPRQRRSRHRPDPRAAHRRDAWRHDPHRERRARTGRDRHREPARDRPPRTAQAPARTRGSRSGAADRPSSRTRRTRGSAADGAGERGAHGAYCRRRPERLYTILRVRPDVALVDVGLPGSTATVSPSACARPGQDLPHRAHRYGGGLDDVASKARMRARFCPRAGQ